MVTRVTAGALIADNFALQPLTEKNDHAIWTTLSRFLETKDPMQFGKGKDVTRRYGEYNHLHLAAAWHIDHPLSQEKYEVAKKMVVADMKLLGSKGVHSFGTQPSGLPVATAPAAASFLTLLPPSQHLTPAASEVLLLHGTSAPVLLSVLKNGLNERFSGSNAGTAFGDGTYLAEDVGKTDQYGAPDVKYDKSSELHSRLYGNSYRHPGSVFYVLVCRALLGYPARTQVMGHRWHSEQLSL
jgi:hypothetical protein